MFTGIVQGMGVVSGERFLSSGKELLISLKGLASSLKIGDSVSVSGVCLTVTGINNNIFKVFLSKETLSRTNLGKARMGAKLNLEEAIKFGAALGGHLVTGHIDTTGKIATIRKLSEDTEVEIDVPQSDTHLIVPKGSIAVDGVSLTVAEIRGNTIKIVIIPHTLKITTFGIRKRGDMVNLEYDIIGKYMWRFYELSRYEI